MDTFDDQSSQIGSTASPPKTADIFYSQTLCTAAEAYLALSYSVIPIWGMADPARPKVASIEWREYQQRRPTLTEILQWFSNNNFGGLAIVTGSISRLAVLDFDSEELYKQFCVQYPDLAKNHVVKTQRGYHIYFHLPPHLRLPSRRGQGIDLLSDGRYVVARPTCIDGHKYKLIRGGQPKTLIEFEIERIMRFLDTQGGVVVADPIPQPEFRPSWGQIDGIQRANDSSQSDLKPLFDLCQTYREWVQKGRGRNEALFQASLQARDAGWATDAVLAVLADVHVWLSANWQHRRETPAQRYAEARRTVQSAFSRPPRKPKLIIHKGTRQTIPNSVREKLFKSGETHTVRVLNGLRLEGINPGDPFTLRQALELLKGVVGRDSVYAAVKVTNQAGEPIFKRQNPPPLTPPSTANAATDTEMETTKCFIGRGKKPGISPNHRPATIFIMPSDNELCLGLGVKLTRSDPITLADLATAKQTRQAAHRELIRRRPGNYPRRWLARRLGVSCVTVDSYNIEIEGLHWKHCFWEQPIFWSNLITVPDEIEVNGAVLVDETGKRYPARRPIAARLLGQGKRVVYKRQDVNYYWFGDAPPNQARSFAPSQIQCEIETPTVTSFVRQYHPAEELLSILHPPDLAVPIHAPTPLSKPAASHKQVQHIDYRQPLQDSTEEAFSNRVYRTLNERSADPARHISRFNARRLVHTYGIQAVEDVLVLLVKKQGVQNPVSFVVTILRSEYKWQQVYREGFLR